MTTGKEPWKKDGMLVKFDQDEIMEFTIEQKSDQKDLVHLMKDRKYHNVLKWGFIYYPKNCATKGARPKDSS